MPQHFRLLTEPQVTALLPLPDLIEAMATALARFSAGEVLQPVRSVLMVGPQQAYFGLMPAAVADPPQLGAKLVTVFGGNAAKGLPSHLATILLLDPDTGSLIALMDGRYITEARTAAVSAVSARHLAAADASSLAIIGTGVQARSHLEALALVRPLTDVRVWSPRARSRDQFVADMQGHAAGALRAAASAEDAVRGAAIVVLVTSSPAPVIDDAWVAPGAHVISVGACRPDQREMPPALVTRARLVVDSRAAALVESGRRRAGHSRRALHRRPYRGRTGRGRARPDHAASVAAGHHDFQVARHGRGGRGGSRSRLPPRARDRRRHGAHALSPGVP